MAIVGLKMKMVLVTLVAIAGMCSAATHTVGDRTGWTLPPSPSFYSNWASKQTFKVGDVLVFNFQTGQHTVGEVSKASYDSCSTSNTITPVKTTGPANYTISSGGTHYFLCTIPGHCSQGQKLAVTVGGSPSAAPAPPPSTETPTLGPSASTSGPSAAGGPSAGGATTPPPPGNSASTAAAGILSLLGLAVAALF